MTHDLFPILRAALWGGGAVPPLSSALRAELQAQAVEGLTAQLYPGSLKYQLAAQFVWMAAAQADAVKLLQGADIPVVVLKGTAAGIYYPQPYLRTYGDIDLLVPPRCYEKALCLLRQNGYVQEGETGTSNTALWKSKFLFELHQFPAGMDTVPEGHWMIDFIHAGFNDIQTAVIEKPACSFPMLPWQQNGLELIWHFRVHLYNGIGLRHAIDWMMFVHRCVDDAAFEHFKSVLERSGLLVLAKVVTRMCQLYLGLEESITWCRDVNEALCEDLMRFILDQGNFGHKRTDDKAAKVMTKYRTPLSFLKGMQQRGLYSWPALKKHPALRPFAWAYVGVQGVKQYLKPGGLKALKAARAENTQRRALFDQLYGSKLTSPDISAPHVPVTAAKSQTKSGAKLAFRQRLRPIYERICKTPLRAPLYHLQNAYFACRYPLFGKPRITDEDRKNVEQNVTFLYKSFNRQRLAKKLYRCIKRYYPKARVVIADDSAQPLNMEDLARDDTVLHLPFNSGLGKGLAAALSQVKTPYVMRLDDDELLTPRSNVHGQLKYLQKHPEVDLVGLQATHRRPEKRAARSARIRMNKPLKIPAGSVIDGLQVLYKPVNVYVVRTDSLRKVGFDPNIRMIDHHEFFYRAAGQIVCVQDPHAYVMHCHNLFEKADYSIPRGDIRSDAEYIAKKHGAKYQ